MPRTTSGRKPPAQPGRRLKRNYFFIYLVILGAWIVKVVMHSFVRIEGLGTFYHALAVKGVPSWAVVAIFVLTYGSLAALTIWTARRYPGEISEFGARRTDWNL